MLDNVELIIYMKSPKLLMTGCRDMDINIKNAPKLGFSPFVTPKIFFQKSGSVTFVSLWYLTSCKKIEKTNELSLRYSKTDHWPQTTDRPLTDRQGRLLRTPRINPWSKISYWNMGIPKWPKNMRTINWKFHILGKLSDLRKFLGT